MTANRSLPWWWIVLVVVVAAVVVVLAVVIHHLDAQSLCPLRPHR
jgi:hypothetical protein